MINKDQKLFALLDDDSEIIGLFTSTEKLDKYVKESEFRNVNMSKYEYEKMFEETFDIQECKIIE